MRVNFLSKTWRRFFRKRYLLATRYQQGKGQTVVFLHGIASDSSIWAQTIAGLDKNKHRIICIDLLGFGESPKPENSKYSLSEQAKSVARTIKKNKIKQPVTIVGHSLGALVAIEIASRRLVKINKLILCAPPIYLSGDFKKITNQYKKTDRARNGAYFYIYSRIAANPKVTLAAVKKSANKLSGFTLTQETWLPFKYSLVNAINSQQSLLHLKNLQVKATIIYGKLDPFIIPKYYKRAANVNKNISLVAFAGYHRLSPKFSQLIAKTINQK